MTRISFHVRCWWMSKTGRRNTYAYGISHNPVGCTDRSHGVSMIQTSLQKGKTL
jgi:hypothetical protein